MSRYSTSGRPMSPVEAQVDLMKPHVTRPVATSPKRDTDQHTFILAKPPAWALEGFCVNNSAWFDDPVGLAAGEAAKRCGACPVIEQCLAAALTEEHGLSAGNRYTIRGGLSPKERADLSLAAKECERGHRNRWGSHTKNLGPICLECKAEDQKAAYVRRLATEPDFRAKRTASTKAWRRAQREEPAA